MKRLLIAAALGAVALTGCVQNPVSPGDVVVGLNTTTITTRIDQVERLYLDAKLLVDVIEPFLSPTRVAQVRAIEARIEAAIALARRATSIADQLAALKKAKAAIDELNGATPALAPAGPGNL